MFFIVMAGDHPAALPSASTDVNWTWEFSGDLWKFAVPFALAAVWRVWADGTGLTKRREMEKMDERKRERRRTVRRHGQDGQARQEGRQVVHFGSNLSSTAPNGARGIHREFRHRRV